MGVGFEIPFQRVNSIGLTASIILHLLLVTAFSFLSLALAAYVDAVGWVALASAPLAVIVQAQGTTLERVY